MQDWPHSRDFDIASYGFTRHLDKGRKSIGFFSSYQSFLSVELGQDFKERLSGGVERRKRFPPQGILINAKQRNIGETGHGLTSNRYQ